MTLIWGLKEGLEKTSNWCHKNGHGLDGNEGGNERDGSNVVVVEG